MNKKNEMNKTTFDLNFDWIINPFFIYSIIWTISLIIYIISPSKLNNKLSLETIFFIIMTIIVSYYMALNFHLRYRNKRIEVELIKESKFKLILLLIGYLIEFYYSQNIPIISSILGKSSNYATFGIPTFHVIIVTYSVFFAVKNMFDYINFRKKSSLINFSIVLLYFLMIFSRGMLLLLAFCYFSLAICRKKITMKVIIISCIIIAFAALCFGILGNLRVSGQWNDSSVILSISKIEANSKSILSSFYWVEEYLICSLRNFNYNIIEMKPTYNVQDFLYTIIPDFIAKRIFPDFSLVPSRVTEEYTTATTYALTYMAYGYVGIIVEYILYMFVSNYISYTKYRDNTFWLVELTLMSFVCGLSIFDAMLQYSGYSFAIIWGFVTGKMYLKKKNNKLKLCFIKKVKKLK